MQSPTELQLRHEDIVKDRPETDSDSRSSRDIIRDWIEKNGPATPSEVAKSVRVKYNTVKSTMNRMKGDELALSDERKGKYDLLDRVESGLDPDSNRDPIYPAVASAGDGSYEISEDPIGYIEGEDALSRPGRNVFWMPVRGDSMNDTLPKGGLVPVQRFDPTWTELREDDVYLFRLEGAIQIKRLQRRPGERIRVVSDNDNYDDFNIALDDGVDFEILGRVLV